MWWVQGRHVDPATVAAILAAGDLAVMVLEYPAGLFADRVGHRRSLLVGSAFQIAGILLCWVGQGAFGLLSAVALVAIGDAFRSGADEALLYRSCVALGREHDFQTIHARTTSATTCTLVLLTLLGGMVVRLWGFPAVWVGETLLCVAGLGLAVGMAEPPTPRVVDGPEQPQTRRAPTLGSAFLLLIGPAALVGGAAGAFAFVAQTSGEHDVMMTTLLVAGITLAEAAGAAAAAYAPAGGPRQQLLIAACAAAVATVAAAVPVTFYAGVIALSLLVGFAEPLRAAAIQRVVADGARARAASVASAVDMAMSTMGLICAGLWRRRR